MKKTLLYISSALVLLAIIIGGATTSLPRVDAQVVQGALNGYGWSDTIGWTSFNCLTGGPTANNICGTSNYAVSEDASGNLSGYAWSDNIGWIKFGGLSGFPNTAVGTNAKVDASTGNLSGWAQAVAGAGRSDGWDGWISLSGLHMDSSTGHFSGYGWGSEVVGWSTFGSGSGTCNPTVEVCVTQQLAPVVNLTVNGASSASILVNTSAQLSWATTNIDTTKTCSISGGTTATVAAGITTYTVGPFATTAGSPRSYAVTCKATAAAGGGDTTSNNVSLTVTTTPPPSDPNTCPAIANATYCGGSGTVSTLINAPMCPSSSSSYTTSACQFVCNTGFRQLGRTCVLNSTIEEH